MAGEARGELAEVIAKVAVELALQQLGRSEQVFWEESPADSVIRPDITTGINKNRLTNVLLINTSDTARNSDMKYWRNIGEIFDAKARLLPRPTVIALFFRSEIKPELLRLTATIADSSHHVDLDPVHGSEISRWLEINHAKAPSKKAEKEELVRKAIDAGEGRYSAAFAETLHHLATTLAAKLYQSRASLDPLWNLVATDFNARRGQLPRQAKQTLLRRGLARWLVFTDADRDLVLTAHLHNRGVPPEQVPAYAEGLGMLCPRIGGARIPNDEPEREDMVTTTARDLRAGAQFFLDAAGGTVSSAVTAMQAALADAPAEMCRTAAQIREMPHLVQDWHTYVINHWTDLCTPQGCYTALMQCRTDPTMEGAVGLQPDGRVWLYDHLVAILRASSEQNNDYGYGRLMSHFKQAHDVGHLQPFLEEIIVGLESNRQRKSRKWVRETLPRAQRPGERGLLDWLKGEKLIGETSIACYAYSLANLLEEAVNPSNLSVDALIARHSYTLWNKLLTHQDFEPLVDLITVACANDAMLTSLPTVMADQDARTVQNVGWIRVFQFDGGLIYWKSVTDAGKDHKRKELAGRARALRYSRFSESFSIRPEARRLILVIDGTFDDDDLKVLYESGWDEIYYPDEMAQLAASIHRV